MNFYRSVCTVLLVATVSIAQPTWALGVAGQPMGNPEQSKSSDAAFKESAKKFVQNAQAYLAVTTLQWQSFMVNPRADSVPEVSRKNSEMKAAVAAEFSALMGMDGKTDALADKIKDYYAAWTTSFGAMRPAGSEGASYFSARTNSEMNRMEGIATRLKLDLE